MKQYSELAEKILTQGHPHDDRTGVGRISLYGETLKFKMSDGFPMVTTRQINYQAAFKEMLWFISGSSNTEKLGSKIWDSWKLTEEDIADFVNRHKQLLEELNVNLDLSKKDIKDKYLNSIGNMYGTAWRYYPKIATTSDYHFLPKITEEDFASDIYNYIKTAYELHTQTEQESISYDEYMTYSYHSRVDQLHNLVQELKNNPYGSRHVITTWVPSWLPAKGIPMKDNIILGRGVLAPCHVLVQCHVIPPTNGNEKPKLILQMYQRSADFMVGSAFNIAQYALLLHLLAKVTGYEPYEFVYNLGDVHIYKNQVEQAKLQLSREPLRLPTIKIADTVTDLFSVKIEDIEIVDYKYHDKITYPVAV